MLLRDGHLRGRCTPVNVGDERQTLLRLQCLLHPRCPQGIQFGLRLTLLLCAYVVQEVDVLLAQRLSSLAQPRLLHAQITHLRGQ